MGAFWDGFGDNFGYFLDTFWALGEPSGATWAPTRFMDAFWRSFGKLLGQVWEPLGAPWGPLGAPWGAIGLHLGAFGSLFGSIFLQTFSEAVFRGFGVRFLRFFH